MIRKASTTDIDRILQITQACAKHMINNNIKQWNAHYPNQNAFQLDLKRNELYVLEFEQIPIGCITISSHMDAEYTRIKWKTPNTNNRYLHRLAIHPAYQGKGFAQQLMDFAETHALEQNCASIRLDTFSKNQRNQKFYELRGYQKLGAVYFPKQSEAPFFCYELVL